MSHIATVEVSFTNLDDLNTACKRVGLELLRDIKEFRFYGGAMAPCDHVVRIPPSVNDKAYEIGLRKNDKGSYDLACDFWGGGKGILAVVGKDCNNLKQAYAIAAAARTARANGFRVQEKQLANGSYQLVCCK